MSSTKNEQRFSLESGPEHDALAEFRADVRSGLSANPKHLSCRFLYDERGSELFEEICRQPEYYPTRTEASILRGASKEIAERFETPPRLIELGSGSAEKTIYLIEALIETHGELLFEPIDISPTALEASAEGLLAEFPELEVRAIAAEYVEGLQRLSREDGAERSPWLVAWLGSSLGNFHRKDATAFMVELRNEMHPGDGLLLGIDARKEADVLEAAYDDAAGVTAAFMRNLFSRANRELGANFDPDAFDHRAVYNDDEGRVEMSLVSREDAQVRIEDLDLDVEFRAGEAIHMENSYKYSQSEVEALARDTGMTIAQQWADDRDRFRLVLLEL